MFFFLFLYCGFVVVWILLGISHCIFVILIDGIIRAGARCGLCRSTIIRAHVWQLRVEWCHLAPVDAKECP